MQHLFSKQPRVLFYKIFEPSAEGRIGKVLVSDFIVLINRPLPKIRIRQNLFGQVNNRLCDIPIKLDCQKSLWLYILCIDGIGVDHNGFAKIKGLHKSITETLEDRRIGDQVRMVIDIGQGVDLPSIFRSPSIIIHHSIGKKDIDIHVLGIFP